MDSAVHFDIDGSGQPGAPGVGCALVVGLILVVVVTVVLGMIGVPT